MVSEILDEELGLDVRGPVGILLNGGADAYLPPRPIEDVARGVHRFLTGLDAPALVPATGPRPASHPRTGPGGLCRWTPTTCWGPAAECRQP